MWFYLWHEQLIVPLTVVPFQCVRYSRNVYAKCHSFVLYFKRSFPTVILYSCRIYSRSRCNTWRCNKTYSSHQSLRRERWPALTFKWAFRFKASRLHCSLQICKKERRKMGRKRKNGCSFIDSYVTIFVNTTYRNVAIVKPDKIDECKWVHLKVCDVT